MNAKQVNVNKTTQVAKLETTALMSIDKIRQFKDMFDVEDTELRQCIKTALLQDKDFVNNMLDNFVDSIKSKVNEPIVRNL
jgi:hypothetical protein